MEKRHEFEAVDARKVEEQKRKEERLEKQSKFVKDSKENREHHRKDRR